MVLIRYLVARWKSRHSCIGSTDVNVGFDETCISLNGNNVSELFCNHEEADTRLIFHAKQMSQSFEKIVIHTPDTDVLLIALGLGVNIDCKLFMKTGVKKQGKNHQSRGNKGVF